VEDLDLAYYDEATSTWVTLESTVDSANNRITAEITHFTVFALVNVPKYIDFTISSLNIWPANVAAGEKVTISAMVTNVGNSDSDYIATLQINGVNAAEQSFTLAVGANQIISFDVVKENTGIYNVDLNGLSGSFTVNAAQTPEPTLTPTPTPSSILKPTAPQSPTPTPAAASETTTNWGIIIGVIAGAAVIIWLPLFFLLRKRQVRL
jgi:hypothetical protein